MADTRHCPLSLVPSTGNRVRYPPQHEPTSKALLAFERPRYFFVATCCMQWSAIPAAECGKSTVWSTSSNNTLVHA